MTLLPVVVLSTLLGQANATGSERWEPNIQKFERDDQRNPPAKGGWVFIGSSSIRMWDLEESFPGKGYLNRGFGGSQIADANHYFDRIVLPYEPIGIVFYAGDNDLAARKTPERVLADFKEFARKTHKAFPETKIAFIAIKPSLRRWEGWKQIKKANTLVKEFCDSRATLHYVDIATPMLGEDGRPMEKLLAKDGLHLSDEGYKVWTAALEHSGVFD